VRGEGEEGVYANSCAWRASHTIHPSIHPSIPRKTERRERDRSKGLTAVRGKGGGDCRTRGAQRRDGECSRGATVRP